MKTTSFLAVLLLVIVSAKTTAQVYMKTEYFGSSKYKDIYGNKVGNSKGSATQNIGSARWLDDFEEIQMSDANLGLKFLK